MDALDLLRFQVRQAQAWLEMTVSNITQEEANWQPPGIANSICATYAHLMISADEDLNMLLYGGETLLSTDWKGKSGLSELPPPEFGWDWHDWAKRVRVDWAGFRDYARAVRASIEEHVSSLTMDVLEREVDMSQWRLGAWKGLEFYNVHGIDHPYLHGGEIACLKGMQGKAAWRTGWQSELERPM